MCGIAGFISFKADTPSNPDNVIRAMTNSIRHRGPDGEGFWSSEGVHLGHRRLSVIDLETGDQPMVNDKGKVIVFNGEIYNYKEIRQELETKKYIFKTDSDTEVLLQAFQEWGEACLDRLNGMFAFAIWDQSTKKLFIARDRVGKKPFYYYLGQGFFAFASELKGLMTIPEIKDHIDIDPQSISDYLSLGYILSPKSIYKQIKKLPPASAGWLCSKTSDLKLERYWKLEDHYLTNKLPNSRETEEAFRELLFDAVKIRLYADVPIAGFLSGGIDSAAILVAMAKIAPKNSQSLCMGFEEASFDESGAAKTTAGYLGIPLEILNNKTLGLEGLEKLIWHTDEPFADTSVLPTYQLCQAAKKKITVALSGDGADEILAGYPTYQADRIFRFYQHLPTPLQKMFNNWGKKFLKPSYKKISFDYKARQFLGAAGMSPREAHYWWRNVFSEDEKANIMTRELQKELKGYSPFHAFDELHNRVPGISFLDQSLYVDCMTWLPDDILVKVDRMSMANGLEVRSPFLDYRLIEFAAKLPVEMKFSLSQKKAVLRKVMSPYLPPQTLKGPKRGFNAPVNRTLGLALKEAGASTLFNTNFELHPEKEDVTFKSFLLSGLDRWIKMEHNFKASGKWTHGTNT